MANRSSTSTSRYSHAQADEHANEHANEPTREMFKDEKGSPTSEEHITTSSDMQEDPEQQRAIVYLHGWRLHVLTLACENPHDHVTSTESLLMFRQLMFQSLSLDDGDHNREYCARSHNQRLERLREEQLDCHIISPHLLWWASL